MAYGDRRKYSRKSSYKRRSRKSSYRKSKKRSRSYKKSRKSSWGYRKNSYCKGNKNSSRKFKYDSSYASSSASSYTSSSASASSSDYNLIYKPTYHKPVKETYSVPTYYDPPSKSPTPPPVVDEYKDKYNALLLTFTDLKTKCDKLSNDITNEQYKYKELSKINQELAANNNSLTDAYHDLKKKYDLLTNKLVIDHKKFSDFYLYDSDNEKLYLHKVIIYDIPFFHTFFNSTITSDKTKMKVDNIGAAKVVLSHYYLQGPEPEEYSPNELLSIILFADMLEQTKIKQKYTEKLIEQLTTLKSIDITTFCNMQSNIGNILPDEMSLILHQLE